MSINTRLLAGALAAGLLLAASAVPAADHRDGAGARNVLWLLVFLRVDGFMSSEALATKDQCEETRLAEMLSRRPKWKPEITMISECVPVRLHDIRLKSPIGKSP